MDRILRSAARARERRRTGEAGFTLVEVLVAMVILSVALLGLAQLSGNQMVATLRSRQRTAAIAYVNQQLESFKSMAYTRIAMDQSPGNGSTAPPTSMNGLTNPIYGTGDCGSSTCLYYEKTGVSMGGFTFTVDRWVDGVGTAAPWNYKTVIVKVTATTGPTFTYSAQTDVSGATTNNPQAVNTLQINVEQVDSGGNVVDDPSTGNPALPPDGLTVTVTSSGTTVASGTTSDGYWSTTSSSLSLNTAYTCSVTNPGGTTFQNWAAYTTGDGSFTCFDGTTYTSRWVEQGCTASTSKGSLTVTVTDTSGNALSGFPVKLTAQQSQPGAPGQVNTNTSGVATFNANVPGGLWSAGVSKGGYVTSSGSTTCIWSGQTSLLTIVMVPNPKAPVVTGSLSVLVENTAPGGTATMEVAAVDTATGKLEYLQQQDIDGCGSSCSSGNTFTVPVYSGTAYTVTLYCTGVGGSATDGEGMTNWTTTSITNTGWSAGSTAAAYECPTS